MKLYHVSYNKVDRFIPRVPKERAEGENDDIPRICFSDSIEKCIAAKPSGPTALEIAEEEGIPVCLYVYSIDTEDYDKHDLFDPITTVRMIATQKSSTVRTALSSEWKNQSD